MIPKEKGLKAGNAYTTSDGNLVVLMPRIFSRELGDSRGTMTQAIIHFSDDGSRERNRMVWYEKWRHEVKGATNDS